MISAAQLGPDRPTRDITQPSLEAQNLKQTKEKPGEGFQSTTNMGGDSPVEEFYRDKVSSQISQSKRVVDSPSLGGFHHWGDRLHRESSFGETTQVEF